MVLFLSFLLLLDSSELLLRRTPLGFDGTISVKLSSSLLSSIYSSCPPYLLLIYGRPTLMSSRLVREWLDCFELVIAVVFVMLLN